MSDEAPNEEASGKVIPLNEEVQPETTRELSEKRRKKAKKKKKKNKLSERVGGLDAPFLMLIVVLSLVGLVMLFSASYSYAYYYEGGDSFYFIRRQTMFAIVGFVIMLVIANIPYQIYHKFATIGLITALVLLVLVLFIGQTINNAKRWLGVGDIFTFQPSEVAKVAMVVAFSSYVDRLGSRMKTLSYGIAPFLGVLGMIAALLMKQPHLSATIIIVLTGIAILFLGGAHLGKLTILILIGGAAVYWIVFGMGYSIERIVVWMLHGLNLEEATILKFVNNPALIESVDAYQSLQSFYAVGSGGLWGLGLGQSRQKHLFLPEPSNDFIFAILCEELGFVGAMVVILLFAAFIVRGYYIAIRARDKFGSLIVGGIITMLALQIFINISVVCGLLPVTGASLPFFSYGGTSLIILYAQMGLVLAVSKQILAPESVRREQDKKQRERSEELSVISRIGEE